MKSYLLRNIDSKVWDKIKYACYLQDISIRKLVLDLLKHYSMYGNPSLGYTINLKKLKEQEDYLSQVLASWDKPLVK